MLQAIAFYVPHYIWKAKEAQLIYRLTDTFREPVVCEQEKQDERSNTIQRVAEYFVPNVKVKGKYLTKHQPYFYCFALAESANLLNVLVQIYLVNEFLGGTFTTYGLDVLGYSEQEERVDPMISVFPKMTKCTFHRFGSSGDVQRYDALCILPLNIVNEKIYIVMWFWFVFLALVTFVWLIFRFVTMIHPELRIRLLTRKATLTDPRHIRYVLTQLDSGDWFLLTMMCKNMDSEWFRELMKLIDKEIKKRPKPKQPIGKNNHTESGRSNKTLLPEDNSEDEISIGQTPPGRRRRDPRDDFQGILVDK